MSYKKEKALKLCDHLLAGGKVLVKDSFDKTIKQSRIHSVNPDYTVTLVDTIDRHYSSLDVTIIPLEDDTTATNRQ